MTLRRSNESLRKQLLRAHEALNLEDHRRKEEVRFLEDKLTQSIHHADVSAHQSHDVRMREAELKEQLAFHQRENERLAGELRSMTKKCESLEVQVSHYRAMVRNVMSLEMRSHLDSQVAVKNLENAVLKLQKEQQRENERGDHPASSLTIAPLASGRNSSVETLAAAASLAAAAARATNERVAAEREHQRNKHQEMLEQHRINSMHMERLHEQHRVMAESLRADMEEHLFDEGNKSDNTQEDTLSQENE